MQSTTTSRRTFSIGAAVAGLVAVGGLAIGTPAASATTETLPPVTPTLTVDQLKAQCNAQITKRHTTLDALTTQLAAAAAVTDAHRTSLNGMITTTKANLDALKPLIDAGTTLAAVRKPCVKIVTENRVYVLRVPQVRLTIGLDSSDATIAKLSTKAVEYQQRINTLKAAGKNTAAAQNTLNRLKANIAAEKKVSANKADALIALVPASYNANNSVVVPFTRATARARDLTRLANYWSIRTNAELVRIR